LVGPYAWAAWVNDHENDDGDPQYVDEDQSLSPRLGTNGRRVSEVTDILSRLFGRRSRKTRANACPLAWAGAERGLGNALARLGERERTTAHLEEAVAAYRAALEEYTRERAPVDWASAQLDLGNALKASGSARTASRGWRRPPRLFGRHKEDTRERVPLA
jgi:hypothetical protein